MSDLKEQIRICGIDDAPFDFKGKGSRALVVGAVVRAPSYLEGVIRLDVAVDGDDATGRISEALASSRFLEQMKAVMLDGVTFAGFNVVDIAELHDRLGVPIITVTREKPDLDAMRAALMENFEDWKQRWERISKARIVPIDTGHKPVHVGLAGISRGDAEEIIRLTMVRGAIPEPLRMAHIIASGIERGESKGKA